MQTLAKPWKMQPTDDVGAHGRAPVPENLRRVFLFNDGTTQFADWRFHDPFEFDYAASRALDHTIQPTRDRQPLRTRSQESSPWEA